MSKAQAHNNRVQGQGIRRTKEVVKAQGEILAGLVENQGRTTELLAQHSERHDQHDRDFKMVKAQLAELQRERARNS